VATTKPDKRRQLLDTCQRLLASGDCIDPFNWIVEKHIRAFHQNPEEYDWKRVDVHCCEIEQEVVRRTLINDELARLERESATETKQSFEDIFCSMRPAFDEVFSRGSERPVTFAEFVEILQRPGGAIWTGYGRNFYARNVAAEPDEAKIRDFAGRCPPFLMMILAAAKAQYERAIVETPRRRKRAGRVDLLMSVYLPYCRVFVTNDDDQELCLREMAEVADLETEILSYEDFRSSLLAVGS